MKKLIALLAAASMLAMLLTACGNTTVKEAADTAKEAVTSIAEEVKEDVSEAAEDVKEAVEEVKEAMSEAVEDGQGAAEDIAEAVSEAVDDAKEAVTDVSEAIDDVEEAVQDAAEAVSEAAEDAVEEVKAAAAGTEPEEEPQEVSEEAPEEENKESAEETEKAAATAIEAEDGTYMMDVAMEGGSGKASILSPCVVKVEDGQAAATIIWSSENYDYMIVDEVHYDPVTIEGGSTFEIPVAAFDAPITVIGDTTAMSQPHEIEYTFTFDSASMTVLDAAEPSEEAEEEAAEAEVDAEADAAVLKDGEYLADFHTDSSMFHVNEACEGKGTLTVKDGEMTIHVSLVSKKIVNLFPGLAEDAEKEGAELLEPTVDEVTYSDGFTEEVYGFDIPVPAIDEEFDVAIIGEKEEWYDHKVRVSNPQPAE